MENKKEETEMDIMDEFAEVNDKYTGEEPESEEAWENQYPLNTFKGETKKELEELIRSEKKKSYKEGLSLRMGYCDDDLIKRIKEQVKEEFTNLEVNYNNFMKNALDAGFSYNESEFLYEYINRPIFAKEQAAKLKI